jgi:ankyrin repeat protein
LSLSLGNEQVTYDIVKLLLTAYPQACRVGTEQENNLPLHTLLIHGDKDINMDLLGALVLNEYKAAAREKNKDNLLPMQLAIARNSCSNTFLYQLADAYPAAAKEPVNGSGSMLHWACHSSKPLMLVQKVLEGHAESVQVKDLGGNLPIHVCCKCGDRSALDVMQHLIKVYPEGMLIKDNDGNTPLHSACENLTTHLAVVVGTMLAAECQSVEKVGRDGNLPLHSACEKKNPNADVIMRLIDSFPGGLEKKGKEGNLPLHRAIEVGDSMPTSVLKSMVTICPQALKVKNMDGYTPLHSACEHRTKGLKAIVALMLGKEEGKEAAAMANSDGNLPLHSACEKKNPDSDVIMRLIDSFPGGLEKKGRDGNLPLHRAIEVGNSMPTFVLESMITMYPQALKVRSK